MKTLLLLLMLLLFMACLLVMSLNTLSDEIAALGGFAAEVPEEEEEEAWELKYDELLFSGDDSEFVRVDELRRELSRTLPLLLVLWALYLEGVLLSNETARGRLMGSEPLATLWLWWL